MYHFILASKTSYYWCADIPEASQKEDPRQFEPRQNPQHADDIAPCVCAGLAGLPKGCTCRWSGVIHISKGCGQISIRKQLHVH